MYLFCIVELPGGRETSGGYSTEQIQILRGVWLQSQRPFPLAGLCLQRLRWWRLPGCKGNAVQQYPAWGKTPSSSHWSCLARCPQCTLLVSAGQYKGRTYFSVYSSLKFPFNQERCNKKEKKNIQEADFEHSLQTREWVTTFKY